MIWIKKDGAEIEVNDLPATVEKAQSLGWTKKEEKKAVKKEAVKKKTKQEK